MAIAVVAGCSSSPGQVIGTGTVTLDNNPAAKGAWMVASAFFDDTMPDAPTTYIGWTVLFSEDAPGTPCSDVRYPSWTAQVFVYSASKGSTPEDAPITPGTFDVSNPAAPPNASIQKEGGVAGRGMVTVTAFDGDHIEGNFTASGETMAIPPELFAISGSFDATRCDF